MVSLRSFFFTSLVTRITKSKSAFLSRATAMGENNIRHPSNAIGLSTRPMNLRLRLAASGCSMSFAAPTPDVMSLPIGDLIPPPTFEEVGKRVRKQDEYPNSRSPTISITWARRRNSL